VEDLQPGETLLTPATWVFGGLADTLRPPPAPRRYANDQDLDRIIADRDEWRAMAEGLESEVRQLEEKVAWLQNIREQIDLEAVRIVEARVLSYNGSKRNPVLTIDRGAKAGIRVNQSVELDGNLVGFVTSAGQRTADVTLITRAGAQYRALIKPADPDQRPYELAEIITLGKDGESFYVDLNKTDGGAVGDYVHLADDAGIYPEQALGRILGRVSSVDDAPDKPLLMNRLVIRPTLPLARLSRVLVLVPAEAEAEDTP